MDPIRTPNAVRRVPYHRTPFSLYGVTPSGVQAVLWPWPFRTGPSTLAAPTTSHGDRSFFGQRGLEMGPAAPAWEGELYTVSSFSLSLLLSSRLSPLHARYPIPPPHSFFATTPFHTTFIRYLRSPTLTGLGPPLVSLKNPFASGSHAVPLAHPPGGAPATPRSGCSFVA